MKILTSILLLFFLQPIAYGQLEMSFDNTMLGGKEQSIYSQRFLEINQLNETYIVGAYKGSTSIGPYTLTTNSNIPTDLSRAIYISKYDSLQNLIWLKKIAESDSLRNFIFKIDDSSNLVFAFEYRTTLYLLNDTIQNEGLLDVIIVKFDSALNLKSTLILASPCFETINDLALDDSNQIYIAGNFGIDANNTVNNCPTYFDNFLLSDTNHTYLAKINSNHNIEWVKTFNVETLNQIYIKDTTLFCIGQCVHEFNSIGGVNFSYIAPFNYISKSFISRLNLNGNGIWVRKFGSRDQQSAGLSTTSLTSTGNKIIFTGGAFSNFQNEFRFEGGPTLLGFNQYDYFLAAFDYDGNFSWNTISNSIGSEFIGNLITDNQNNIVGVGALDYTLRFPTDTLYSNGGDDVMVCSYDSSGNFRWAAQGGGWGSDIGSGIAADTHGQLFIVGGTTSPLCLMGNDTLMPPANQSTLFFSALDSIVLHIPNAIPSISKTPLQLIASPNPVDQQIQLQGSETGTCYLYDALGRCLFQQRITAWPYYLTTTHYPNGIYLLQFQQHSSLLTQKISIQH